MENRFLAYIFSALVLMVLLAAEHGTAFAGDADSGVTNSTAPKSGPGTTPASYGPGFHKRPVHPPVSGFHGRANRASGMRNAPGPGNAEGYRHRKQVTPYGDFCPLCTTYGMGKKAVGMDNALEALTAYFKRKGLDIKNVEGHGRFLKAEVFHQGVLVDKILFDRRTGRIRSIY